MKSHFTVSGTFMYAATFATLQPAHDPRHIEAFVRLQYGPLDHLDRNTLREEAKVAAQCVTVGGVDAAEELAVSYGL